MQGSQYFPVFTHCKVQRPRDGVSLLLSPNYAGRIQSEGMQQRTGGSRFMLHECYKTGDG